MFLITGSGGYMVIFNSSSTLLGSVLMLLAIMAMYWDAGGRHCCAPPRIPWPADLGMAPSGFICVSCIPGSRMPMSKHPPLDR
jgi:hypothetical protein